MLRCCVIIFTKPPNKFSCPSFFFFANRYASTSNILKSTLLKRSNTIPHSLKQCRRNLNTKSKFQDYRKKIVYNTKVFEEFVKEVYKKENLGPPNKVQIVEAWENFKSLKLQNIYDLGPRDLVKLGIRSIEVAGFFAIGEIIGRFNIIGYDV